MRQLALLVLICIIACNSPAKKDGPSVQSETGSSGTNVRNGISLKTNGITVEQAFLMFDDGRLVPKDNKVEVGQPVRMRLILKGWEAVNGKVMLGASEKITTDEGQVILDEADLFGNAQVDAADAGAITLTAVITRIDKLFKYFEVSFRVWDKNSSDQVTGSYRLYLK